MSKSLVIAYLIFLGFSFWGFVAFGNTVHELIHYYDMKTVPGVKTEDICFLGLSEEMQTDFSIAGFFNYPMGWYHFRYPTAYKDQVDQWSVPTEIKAYGVEAFLFLLFCYAQYILQKSIIRASWILKEGGWLWDYNKL